MQRTRIRATRAITIAGALVVVGLTVLGAADASKFEADSRSEAIEPVTQASVHTGVYENVAASFCMPLCCTAFDCVGEVARTP